MINGIDEWCNLIVLTVYFELVINEELLEAFQVNNDDVSSFSNSVVPVSYTHLVIDRLDYRPNAVARGLASKKTTTVGVVIPNIANSYFATLARGIDDIATMYKYNIVLASSDENDDHEVTVINSLFAKDVYKRQEWRDCYAKG